MKGRQIVLGQFRGREAAALLVDGRLDDLLLAPDDDTPALGAIYRAIVDRPLKGQGGVIVRLPGGGRGFLKQAKGLKPGEAILVQVTGYAEDGKAAPVTSRILFKSRYAIVTPDAPGLNISRQIKDDDQRDRLTLIAHEIALEPGHGAIIRSLAETAEDDEVAEDLAQMADLAAQVMADTEGEAELLLDGPSPGNLAWRDWPASDWLEDPKDFGALEIAEMIEAAADDRVALGEDGSMYVEPTRALVAVDVNTGGDTTQAAGLKANLAAVRALPRALRIRGLAGQIVLDLAPLSKVDRNRFEQGLKAAFRNDPVETMLIGWTPLGHYELMRKRERLALAGLL